MKKILVAAVLVFTLCCCEQRKVAREMKAFMETEIRFTDDRSGSQTIYSKSRTGMSSNMGLPAAGR